MSYPDNEAVKQGVLEAFTDAGYITGGTRKDTSRLRTRIVEMVSEAIVTKDTKKDREDHAIRLTDMITRLFPGLPESDEDDDGLASAIYKQIRQDVWNQLQVGARGAVQRAMHNGSVLCRTKIGPDNVQAVYITSNLKNIFTDTLNAQIEDFRKRVGQDVEDRLDLIRRLTPEDAKRVMSSWVKEARQIEADARERLTLAVETKVSGEIEAAPEPEADTPEAA
jgi:hypothetical protein